MEKLKLKIKDKEVSGFYFTAKVKLDGDMVYLNDFQFESKTLSYMLSGLSFVYVFFIYLKDNKTNDYYDVLHLAEEELIKKVGLKKETYSIFKPGLIIDWKDKQILKFIDFIKSEAPNEKIEIDENTYKVIPEYSSFGVLFESTLTSISCMFCDLLSCKYRRSPLDEKLIEKIYRLENSNASKL